MYEIAARIEAMDAVDQNRQGLPRGQQPKAAQAKMSGMNRRARRHAERQNKGK